MNTTEQIKALAELDGWKLTQKTIPVWEITQYDGSGEWTNKEVALYENDGATKKFERLPNYLTSYDAIIPLIQKQPFEIRNTIANSGPGGRLSFMSIPAQLCEALLRATGKWKE